MISNIANGVAGFFMDAGNFACNTTTNTLLPLGARIANVFGSAIRSVCGFLQATPLSQGLTGVVVVALTAYGTYRVALKVHALAKPYYPTMPTISMPQCFRRSATPPAAAGAGVV